jgi:hypothetical protein
MTTDELKARTKQFALRVIKLVAALPMLEQADETQLWLELIIDAKLIPAKRVQPLLDEAGELVAIFVASRKSASLNLKSAI